MQFTAEAKRPGGIAPSGDAQGAATPAIQLVDCRLECRAVILMGMFGLLRSVRRAFHKPRTEWGAFIAAKISGKTQEYWWYFEAFARNIGCEGRASRRERF